jgi:UDP-N-acetylmuramoyl-L-alanyl-D-glutamate--2,6-diaminopimelate ligase
MAPASRRLSDLGLAVTAGADVAVADLSVDSRSLPRGALFAALPGVRAHGATFAAAALDRGAAAVLTDAPGAALCREAVAAAGAALVVVQDARAALAGAAALWFGAQPDTVVAVTGTNGKTSTATFARQLFAALGHAAVNIGTTGVEGAWEAPTAHTTPDTITLHRLLAAAAAAGVTRAAIEASSHGLDQRRLDGVRLAAAAFSNLTQDHLDYHGTMAAYWQAKRGLFDRLLPEGATAVVNIDDPAGEDLCHLAAARGHRLIRVGRAEGADLHLTAQRFDATGQTIRFAWAGRSHQTRLDLVGGFQAGNALLAAGLCLGAGEAAGDVFAALPRLSGVRGRMQRAATRANGAAVFVDYAHTPDAVATALQALRPHVLGRIVIVLGAGGDRDRSKRPLMGAAAATNADAVIVTDDNPRSEDPALIRAAILAAAPEATEVPDRAEAILRGVDALEPGDALLIAGKGHETGQIVGTDVFPFDDLEQASIAVAALDGII